MFPKNRDSVLEAGRLGLLPGLSKALWENTLSKAEPVQEGKEPFWPCLQGFSIAFNLTEMILGIVILIITLLPNEITS